MKTGIVVQARAGSQRLPQKMLLPFYGEMTLLDFVLSRVFDLGYPVVLATSTSKENDDLEAIAKNIGIPTVRGSENNLIDRFNLVALTHGFTNMIRVCGDNPLLDTHLLLSNISTLKTLAPDYVGWKIGDDIAIKTHYGFFSEGVSTKAIKRLVKSVESEHLTDVIYKSGRYDCIFKELRGGIPLGIRLTIDTQEDFDLVKTITKALLDCNIKLNYLDICKFIIKNKTWMDKMALNIKNNPK